MLGVHIVSKSNESGRAIGFFGKEQRSKKRFEWKQERWFTYSLRIPVVTVPLLVFVSMYAGARRWISSL